ncbi:MAG TPA: hypothetical protein EYQ50_20800 [Verrucomicrobiales bacterium]|nr:hypothetical protein [Verrucomicrobiales bacterium]HIL71324.1 hypothetical protein [Verrucomicrobiota bacterium]
MKLATWAKANGLTYLAAWKRYKAGTLPVRAWKGDTGAILIDPGSTGTCIYVRIDAGHDNVTSLLDKAEEACSKFCRSRKWKIDRIFKETGSGKDDQRLQLIRMLESKPTRIVTLNPDCLAEQKFGQEFLSVLLPQLGCELVYINKK